MNFIGKVTNKLSSPPFYGSLVAGFSFWGILIFYRMLPQSLVFIHIVFFLLLTFTGGIALHRLIGPRWHQQSILALTAILYLGLALAANYNVLFFYLLTPVYYPFPPPNHADLRTFLIFSAVAANAVIYLYYGGKIAAHLEITTNLLRDLALGIFGFALGNLLVNLIAFSNWPLAFFFSLILLFILFAQNTRQRLFALISILAIFIVLNSQQDIVYTGSLQDARLEMQIDSPYARTHIYSYNDGECVTIASNYHSITFNCRDPQKLPRGLKYLFEKLIGGKDGYRAMIIGRSLGMYPNTLLAANPAVGYIQTVEFDPEIMKAVRDRFAAYTVEKRFADKIGYAAGDLSRFVLDQHEKYDLVFFNGIGLSQFQIPFCLPYQEQFLFTPKVLDHVFNELLTDDGLLIVDWGGRSSDDQIHQIGNFPPDVQLRTFWYVMTEPPFTGTPLYYLMASKDHKRLAEISDYLKRSTFFKDISYVSSSKPFSFSLLQMLKDRSFLYLLAPDNSYGTRYSIPFSWDRPFMIHGLFNIQILGLLSMLAGSLLLLVFVLGSRITAATASAVIKEARLLVKKENPLQGMPDWMILALPFLTVTVVVFAVVQLFTPPGIELFHLRSIIGILASLLLLIILPRLLKNFGLFFKLLSRLATESVFHTRQEIQRVRLHFPRLFYLWPLKKKAAPWLVGAITVAWLIDAVGRQSHQLAGYGYTWPWAMLVFLTALSFVLRRPPKKDPSILGNLLLTLVVMIVFAWSQMDIDDTPSFLLVPLVSGLLCGTAWRRIVISRPRIEQHHAVVEIVGGITGAFVFYQILLFILGFNMLAGLASIGMIFVFWRVKNRPNPNTADFVRSTES